jgi:hypothetical protein
VRPWLLRSSSVCWSARHVWGAGRGRAGRWAVTLELVKLETQCSSFHALMSGLAQGKRDEPRGAQQDTVSGSSDGEGSDEDESQA